VIFYRKALLTLVFALLFVGLVGGCGGGGGQAGGGAGGNKQLNIGYINWDEDVAVSNVAKILLEEKLGYDVKLTLAEVGPLYSGVAGGDIDAFLDVWLPNTHKTYWEQYQNQVVDLGRWYEGTASLGLGVPDYVEAQSIEDLNKYRDEFGGKIIGIEPGAGIMRIAEDNAIPGYGLDYELVASSTPAMISELEKAMNNQQPIVFTAWKPHWMFTAYNIRYLEDPKGEMGTPEELSAITRTGLEQDAPEASKFLDNISLTEEQLGDLELAIRDAGDPEQGARDWLEKNRELADSWLPGSS
jgi:glycine betaine/proline transport system substrate-binding protein